MKNNIKMNNLEITLDSTKESTFIKINYTPETPSGKFPDINGYEDYIIVKQICPITKFVVKEIYSDEELIMLTDLLAYIKAKGDLSHNKVVLSDTCNWVEESDSTYTFTLYIPTIDNNQARGMIEIVEDLKKQIHSERIKNGIKYKKIKDKEMFSNDKN